MPFRSCALCERLLLEYRWLCTACETKLKKKMRTSTKEAYLVFKEQEIRTSVRHSYLWEWGDSGQTELIKLIRGFKGRGPAVALKPWLELLVRKISVENSNSAWQSRSRRGSARTPRRHSDASRPTLWVPAPPADKGADDHAWRLADGLSLLTGFPRLNLLERSDQVKQKFQSRQERRRLKLKPVIGTELLPLLHEFHIAFVDDVVTTGSTAQAAWSSLGQPPDFSVFSLIYRSRLLERGRIDILRQ